MHRIVRRPSVAASLQGVQRMAVGSLDRATQPCANSRSERIAAVTALHPNLCDCRARVLLDRPCYASARSLGHGGRRSMHRVGAAWGLHRQRPWKARPVLPRLVSLVLRRIRLLDAVHIDKTNTRVLLALIDWSGLANSLFFRPARPHGLSLGPPAHSTDSKTQGTSAMSATLAAAGATDLHASTETTPHNLQHTALLPAVSSAAFPMPGSEESAHIACGVYHSEKHDSALPSNSLSQVYA